MREQLHSQPSGLNEGHQPVQSQFVVGGVLVVVGLLLLLGQVFDLGAWVLVILATIFAGAGIATRDEGWFIPSGILAGIGLGALLQELGMIAGDMAEGGVFLLAFAMGWLSITAMTRIFSAKWTLWPLIPATVMVLIGAPLLVGGPAEVALGFVIELLARSWPLGLIAGGIWIIVAQRRKAE